MGIGPLSRIGFAVLGDTLAKSPADRSVAPEVLRAVRTLNGSQLFGRRHELRFSWDTNSRHPIIWIVQRDTGEVIQEIPDSEILNMFAEMEKNHRKGKT
jgi:uncharacterized FlaG/YvyC family protein